MERHLKMIALFGGLSCFWLGVITEALATCYATDVCSYPRTAGHDALLMVGFLSATAHHVRKFMQS